ncbi:MAG TPA: diguanylate cyclase [Rudaea sp.]|nr:diguanylate cyclase [Rudaea sp.]
MQAEPRDLRFVKRLYRMRAFGLTIGSFCVGAVLYTNGAAPLVWALLAAEVLVWPHAAYLVACGSRDPRRAELRNLQVDSALGGMWIALMHFNLVPSVVLVVMLAIDKVNVGGPALLARTFVWQIVACLAAAVLTGFAFQPETTMFETLAALPLLIGYPLAICGAMHAIMRHAHRHNRELLAQNRVDAPTGLLNRAHWQASVAHELRRYERAGQVATLMMIDIDEFKSINDRYGHTAGDEVIRAVAATVRDSTRDIDICGRYGGDEFGVVLVNTSAACARLVGERVRSRVAALRFAHMPALRCSTSIGMAEVNRQLTDVRAWMKLADIALYRAKARGRNRVVAVSPTDAIAALASAAKAQCA